MPKLDELLARMPKNGASDCFLMVGEKPKFKLHGEITPVEDWPVLDKAKLEDHLFELLTPEQKERYLTHLDFDFAYGLGEIARYRCNYFMQRTSYAAVLRIIPSKILTLEELKLPSILTKFCQRRSGLILVTGPTGSGKSTSLAGMINHINENERRRIITIEDPVEFVHKNKKCLISHREVHNHTGSFANALRAVTRQDADVVLVGEMRDIETISLALSAAATGTLVFGTLHTNSAPKTIDRIIDAFPTDQQAQARTVLAESLRGIIAQQLLKKKGGKGRVAVNEILIGNNAVASIIREGRIERITSVLQSGRREGMQVMDDALEELIRQNVIDGADAYMKANDKKRFEKYSEGETAA